MRTKRLAGIVLFLCVLLCTRPVAVAASVGAVQERNVRVIETGPFGYVRWIEVVSPSEKGKRYWVVPSYEYASWKEYTQFRNGYMAIRLTEPPRGIMDSYREAGGLLRMVSMATGNWSLFIRGFRDIWHAVNESANFLGKGMANLNDPQKLYEFWKEKGIYDKYTPGERAFLNQVVMPAVAVAQWSLTLLGGGVTALGLAIGLAPVLAPFGVLVGGFITGAVLATLVALWKGTMVRETGGDINALQLGQWNIQPVQVTIPDTGEIGAVQVGEWNGLFPVAGTMTVLAGALGTGATGAAAGAMVGHLVGVAAGGLGSAQATIGLLAGGVAGGVAAGLVGGLTGYLTMEQEYNLLATYNAYGIPELVETPVPPAVWDDGSSASRPKEKTWELIYSLCR